MKSNSGRLRASTMMSCGALFALTACSVMDRTFEREAGFIVDLPEQVVAVAAPNQNLRAVRLMPDDQCYWYLHVGPVEDTMLPLLTADGQMICSQPSEPVS
jgi:hypothetical protein